MTPTPEQIAKLPKWAKEAWESREKELREAKALRWPLLPEPAIRDMWSEWQNKPAGNREVVTGWSFHSYDLNYRVAQGCSNGVHHSPDDPTKTTSQGVGVFYHTKLDALLAARWKLTRAAAAALAKIDAEIETASQLP